MSSGIRFFSENISFTIKQKALIRIWVLETVIAENKKLKDLNVIFCSDDILFEINRKYMKHNTLTDIITFNFGEEADDILGEIYISIERVEENAKKYKKQFENELHRVIIHGVLHLIGYKDKKSQEKKEMKEKEDYYLTKLAIM